MPTLSTCLRRIEVDDSSLPASATMPSSCQHAASAGMITKILLFLFSCTFSKALQWEPPVSMSTVEAAYTQLQTWYHHDTGLWIPSTGWWNSANLIANLAALDTNMEAAASTVFGNTFVKAPVYNEGQQASKALGVDYLPISQYTYEAGPASTTSNRGFLNGFYDDEGWWALAWIAAYDVTGEEQYLSEAMTIFADMNGTFGQTPCSQNRGGIGGIWWDRAHTYVNAIANELYLSVAAHLANRANGTEAAAYLSLAQRQWAWIVGSGMINANDTINDGLDQSTCRNNNGTVWSYNQGVVLGGLLELQRATNNNTYFDVAQEIADAALSALAPSGILHDPCEPNCGADGTQFKGIFARNLQGLSQACSGSAQARYAQFLQNNAQSIVQNDAEGHEYSVIWSGPYVRPGNASTQSSAMDALVGALAVATG